MSDAPPTLPRLRPIAALRDPIFRGGLFLTLSSTSTALIGLVFWSAAAHRYDTAVVGRSAAAISAMTLLAGFSQLNLTSALIRFVPGAGPDTRRLVLGIYATAVGVAAILAVVFVAIAPSISGQFRFVTDRPLVATAFVLSVMASTVFSLQDGVLTGLRLTHLVALENAVFALAKVAFVAAVATWLARDGILVSWWIGLAVAVAGTNLYLFRGPLLRHLRLARGGSALTAQTLARYAGPDYVGAVCSIVAFNAMPFLIIAEKGATQTAYFAISWQVGQALFIVSANMGQSLVVETATDQSDLPRLWRRLVGHTLVPLLAAVALLVAAAPLVLDIFGHEYRSSGTTLVRLLTLAAIPNLVVETAVFAARSHRLTVVSSAIQAAMCAGVLALGATLLPVMGLNGIGVAWLATLTAIGAVLLARPRWWLHPR